LWCFLLIPLLCPFIYSHVRRPIYIPGRYDIIALPPFLVLFSVGLEKLLRDGWTRRLGYAALAGSVLVSLWTGITMGSSAPQSLNRHRDSIVIRELANRCSADDLVICVGYRYLTAQYAARRFGLQPELVTFPRDVPERPGVYWPLAERYVGDSDRLPREAREITATVLDRLEKGKSVWILDGVWVDRNSRFLEAAFSPRVEVFRVDLRGYSFHPRQLAAYLAVLQPQKPGAAPANSLSTEASTGP
jgi:hypothetical protein